MQDKAQQQTDKQARLPLAQLEQAVQQAAATRPFYQSISAAMSDGKAAIIADIQTGTADRTLRKNKIDVAGLAREYEQAGATCLSLYTGLAEGEEDGLQQARKACALPLLCKDTITDARQIYAARILGADCIMLPAAALSDAQLLEYSTLATGLDLDVMIEVHDREQLERAHVLRTPLICINNRDPQSLSSSLDVTLSLLLDVFPDRCIVSTGGIVSHEDVRELRKHGVNGFLISEALQDTETPAETLRQMFSL